MSLQLAATGAADFHGQRFNQVTIGNFFKHLLMYDDGCFSTNPRFHFIALNTETRWRALQAGSIPGENDMETKLLMAPKLILHITSNKVVFAVEQL